MTQHQFKFVAPMYNASATLPRMLHSIFAQSYPHWQIILIDDVSTDHHQSRLIIEKFRDLERPDRIKLLMNGSKKWEVHNVLWGITHCADDDIVCRIDADDALVDTDALAIINAAYNQVGCDALWTMHRWSLSDRNISGPMPAEVDPYRHPWVSSHLKTFKKRLINNVPYENFINHEGVLAKRCGDQAIYLPVLKNSQKRFFLPRVTYSYTIDEQGGAVYQTDDARFQKAEADFIRARGYVQEGTPWELMLNA